MEPRWTLFILILTLPLALALKKGKIMTKEKSAPRVNGMDAKYYIKSSQCRIWNVQQKSKNATTNGTNIDYRECYQDDDLISTRFHDKYQRYALHINELLSQLIIEYNCSYLEIKRGAQRGLHKEVPFQDGYLVPPDVEAMLASCSNSLGEVLQTRALTFVQPRKGARRRPKRKRRKANVLMLSIGSISRWNFHKNLPELSKHLQMEGWYEMQGYGRVGPGLLPNLMAIITGYSPDTWRNLECHSKKFGCLAGLPLIFSHFKRHGYLTAYGEDVSFQNPFQIGNSSLDYYAQGIDTKAPTDCLARLLNIRYVYEFWQQYLEQHLSRDPPLFGFFRTNSSNYDLFADGNILEPFLMDYFQRFIELGLFKHSIVILFSDGGGGSHEESLLPLLFIWLPPWFRDKHPESVQALHTNSRLLTSPYDLHLTLQHILELGERWPRAVAQLQDCPKCQTLLAPMNESRTCPDVGIADATCPCDSYKPLASSKIKQLPLGALLVRGINDFLHQRNLQELCSNLSLKAVTGVSVRVEERGAPTSPHLDTYRITFSAQPSHLEFAGSLRYNHKLKTLDYLNVGAILRLNSYRKDSECMKKLTGKKFCVCKKTREETRPQIKAAKGKEQHQEKGREGTTETKESQANEKEEILEKRKANAKTKNCYNKKKKN